MARQSLQGGEVKQPSPSKPDKVYISFTDLYAKKQEWLEKQLLEGKEIYILSKKIPPIKVSLAELS